MNFTIEPVSKARSSVFQQIIDFKTKPPGSLGQLETLALQLANIQQSKTILLRRPQMLVFAADHGIAEENLSIASSEVTQQMVQNFLNGGAAINCFCRLNQINLEVIDAGILSPIDTDNRLVKQRLGNGTENFSKTRAMSLEQMFQGIDFGADRVRYHHELGTNIIGFGEMGIGNTSSASAIVSLLTDLSVKESVGRGTGIDEIKLQRKRKVIERAIKIHQNDLIDLESILSTFGGFEIVQMVGAMLAAAEKKMIILVDGFIATTAALVACKMYRSTQDYMVFCHQSKEKAHGHLLNILNAEPILSLDMRLGEGTGCALAYPIVKASAAFFNEMASFRDAGVTAV